ncbi:hypothetical protein G6F50_017661 [Rhizopus delemar]|uniref:Uncharacterized protein n=1 Tax=Rhizopus delemar TaxID=936053 RepID=A0A9P6XPE0_9FUNG|nr:hypothetical protein G6F50_017661 [Rhizopus delemar]
MRGQSIPLIDAQVALGFVIAQTTIIEPGVYRTVYPDIQYRGLIPVDTEGSEFATSVTYMSQDQFGKADWINGNADDIPKAGTTRAKFETPVYTAAAGHQSPERRCSRRAPCVRAAGRSRSTAW